MAKSKGFFGLRTGSTKSLTFQILDGQQITKDRVYQVRNPRTVAQQVQRIIMLTACMAYSKMKEIVDHSIEGVAYGGKTQQEFVRKAIAMLRTKLHGAGVNYATMRNFTPFGSELLAVNAYEVSRGSLPSIRCSWNGAISFVAGDTYADIINRLGLHPGDQLTFIGLSPLANKEVAFNFARIILQPQDESGTNLPLETPFLAEGNVINHPNLRNENTDLFDIEWNEDNKEISFAPHGVNCVAGTVIASRKVDGMWLRSTQSLLVSSMFIQYTMADALSRADTEIMTSSDRYLNNAGDYENEAEPKIKKIEVDGVVYTSGKTYEGPVQMVITGSHLDNLGIEVYCGANKYIPLGTSDTQLSYTLSSNGTIRVVSGGIEVAQFNVHIAEPLPFEKIAYGSNVQNKVPANFSCEVGDVVTLKVTAVSGKSQSDIAAKNFTLAGTSQTLGNITYSTSGSKVVAEVPVTTRNEGTTQVLWGGELVAVISVNPEFVAPEM